jgi:Phosphomannomutase
MALFREYDIRGVVGQELTEPIAEQIGRAYATVARAQTCQDGDGWTRWP